jgi:Flp pilus assembly protein TadG
MNRNVFIKKANGLKRRASEGQVLVLFAAGLVFLIAMIAVAIDTGFIMAERRQVQNSADAAALAAAKAKLDYLGMAALENRQIEAGKSYGARNADTDEDNVTVDTSPDGFGDEYVEVTIVKDVDMFFMRALYDGQWRTSASAVAGMEPIQLPYALVALNCSPSGGPGIMVSGSGEIDVNEGSIMSNCGIGRDGDSSIVAADGVIDAANGPIDVGTNWHAGQGFRENRPEVEDPLADIPPPSRSDAKATIGEYTTQDAVHGAVQGSTKHQSTTVRCSTTCIMQPGYYGGNITLDVRQGGILDMQPGIYYFGDTFVLTAQGDGLTRGTDVMMYFTDQARFIPHNGRVHISAPAESPYAGGLDGMGLWIANCRSFRLQANNSGAFQGVIYAPCSPVTLSGGPGAQGMQVIVGNLELSGSGTFDILYEEYVLIDVPGVFLVR